jgi:hypothetical protein
VHREPESPREVRVVLATIRDVAIIIVAFFDIVLLAVLVAIAVVVWRLLITVRITVRTELPPLIGSVKKTATTVEGTADFISTTVAMPIIRAVSLVFAVTRFFQVLVGYVGQREERRS